MGSSTAAWLPWVNLLVALAPSIALFILFIFRSWITDRITKGIQHSFDVKLKKLDAELKKNEEQLKSSLRDKEAEIGALRNTVLSGSASRQNLLDKRRFEAVERIWTTVNDSLPLKNLCATMAALNYDVLAKRTGDPKVQELLSTIENIGPNPQLKNAARDERPFVPESAWAYFEAFTTLLTFNIARFKILKIGIEDPYNFLNTERVKDILKAALPHQTNFVDGAQDAGAYYYLLEEIETELLNELRRILAGKEADQSSIEQAKDILSATTAANLEKKRIELKMRANDATETAQFDLKNTGGR
jgi:hypothetical protein